MRIAIIGAGLTGVCTALELALNGHEVHVIERRHAVAAEGSFAPAGLSAAALAADPVLLGLDAVQGPPLRHLGWRWAAWRRRRESAHAERRDAIRALAQSGELQLQTLLPGMAEELEHQRGLLVLLRDDKARSRVRTLLDPASPPLSRPDAPAEGPGALGGSWQHAVEDVNLLLAQEPGLTVAPGTTALHLPSALSLNLRQLTQHLRAQGRRVGVRFHLGIEVSAVRPGPELVWHEAGDSSGVADRMDTVLPSLPSHWDAVVLCNGAGAPALLRQLELPWPWVIGHQVSITAPLHTDEAHPQLGPRAAVVDLQRQVSISRLGHRVRVAGALQLSQRPPKLDNDRLRPLYDTLEDWFPGSVRTARAQQWQGALPCLADGLPLLGPTSRPGVWVHLGQGRHGAAAALGGAHWLARAMTPSGHAPLPTSPLAPTRFE